MRPAAPAEGGERERLDGLSLVAAARGPLGPTAFQKLQTLVHPVRERRAGVRSHTQLAALIRKRRRRAKEVADAIKNDLGSVVLANAWRRR